MCVCKWEIKMYKQECVIKSVGLKMFDDSVGLKMFDDSVKKLLWSVWD